MEQHRTDATPFDAIQTGNRTWWTGHTMSYDWKDRVPLERYSPGWFDEVDRRFLHGARLFAHGERPFGRVIPLDELVGRRVLEIGCGMGLHTELMARAGAQVTALDLSDTSVEATRRRMAVRGLSADVRQGDAEELPFPDRQFNFVWSWGVIHHSSRTAKIVREIARVLQPAGGCRVMVYNREGMAARVALIRDHLLRGGVFRHSYDQTLHHSTDGFSARHYVPDQFEDLFRAFFRDVSSSVCGQDSDALPLPGVLRRIALRLASDGWLRRRQARWGSFLFLRAANPF